MPKTPITSTASGAIAREVLRVGVGRFVTRFARRFRVDGLPAKLAAETAARELAHEAIAGFLGFPLGRLAGRSRAGVVVKATKTKNGAPRPQSGRHTRGPKVDPELERLLKLKRFVGGGASGPTKEGKKP